MVWGSKISGYFLFRIDTTHNNKARHLILPFLSFASHVVPIFNHSLFHLIFVYVITTKKSVALKTLQQGLVDHHNILHFAEAHAVYRLECSHLTR